MGRYVCAQGVAAIIVVLLLTCAGYGAAPRVEIASSPNPVGSGARALGMGGAFIAVADDATAASWNPGGLIQLDKAEMSMVLQYTDRTEDLSFQISPEANSGQSISQYDINYLSAAYPFVLLRRNMIVSFNYQRLYDFNRNWEFDMDIPGAGVYRLDYDQQGGLYATGLAFSTMLTLDLSVGVTLNYWGDFINENSWEQTYDEVFDIAFVGVFPNLHEERFSIEGWNANFGFLWRLSEHWTLGGVFKLPFEADVDHTIIDNNVTTSQSTDQLDMPMAYGIGIAYRHSDELTFSADVYRTHWGDFMYRAQDGSAVSPVSGKAERESDIDTTTWVRAGMEYLHIGRKFVVPFRAGIFYDPAPAEKQPDDYYGFTLGSGIAYKKLIWDVAYQFRYGDNVSGGVMENMGFSQDITEHLVYTSLIIHF